MAILCALRHGRPYTLRGTETLLQLKPADQPTFTTEGHETTLALTPEIATELEAQLRAGLVGEYRFAHWPALRIVVTPSFIRDASGSAVEVRGIEDPDEARRVLAAENKRLAEADDDDDELAEPDADEEEPPPNPVRVKKALAMTDRALRFAPDDGDVQFTHAMLLLDGEAAGLDTMDRLLEVMPSFEAGVQVNVATRAARAEHPRFDEVVGPATVGEGIAVRRHRGAHEVVGVADECEEASPIPDTPSRRRRSARAAHTPRAGVRARR